MEKSPIAENALSKAFLLIFDWSIFLMRLGELHMPLH